MIYDIINIDGDVIGDYNGVLWITGAVAPEFWPHVKHWPYFRSYADALIGVYRFRQLDFTVEGQKIPGVEVFYETGGNKYSVATVVARAKQAGMSDLCPRCRVPGKFIKTALTCPQCHAFLGGF